MSVTFEIAPLVEIIAELKWGVSQQTVPHPQAGNAILAQPNNLDEFFMRFGGEIYQMEFKKSERLVPSGFPVLLHQPVYRYRKESQEQDDDSILYQVGYGIFSANAIQPYRSWEEFSPYVKRGVDALIASRSENERNQPFSEVNLRYLDAFNEHLTQGMDVETFSREVLGISLNVPEILTNLVQKGKTIKPNIQLFIPINECTSLNIFIAEAMVNNELSIMLDCTVSTVKEINPNADDIMETLVISRKIIHDMFVGLTTKIHHLMKPINSKK